MLKYALILMLLFLIAPAWSASDSMKFDVTQWATGDMDEGAPNDSNGVVIASHVDYYFYYERIPMRQDVLDDSFTVISATLTYDSAILTMTVAQNGATADPADQMRIFGLRLTPAFVENQVSWNRRNETTPWTLAGGDVAAGSCTDTILVDINNTVNSTIHFHIDTGFVRYMVETTNIGWQLRAENITDRFIFQLYTEDFSTVGYRPVLTVYYHTTTVPDAARVIGKAYLRKML